MEYFEVTTVGELMEVLKNLDPEIPFVRRTSHTCTAVESVLNVGFGQTSLEKFDCFNCVNEKIPDSEKVRVSIFL